MVDLANRRRASSDSVDWVSSGHIHPSFLAIIVVGARAGHKHNLVVYSDHMVLGLSGYEDMHLAPIISDTLANAVGTAAEQAI
jgi:hypothetical protein